MTHPDGGRVFPPGPIRGAPGQSYYMFMLSVPSRGILLGVTNDLARCLVERRAGSPAARLASARLVYFEVFADLGRAMARKGQLEGWNRSRKLRLILSANPDLSDLSIGLAGRKEA